MTDSQETPDLLRVPEVAETLRTSDAHVWRMIWSGELPAIKVGARAVRVSRRELDAWLDRRPAAVTHA